MKKCYYVSIVKHQNLINRIPASFEITTLKTFIYFVYFNST